MKAGLEYLKFRCTGCGDCCREPLLPLTDNDVRAIMRRTGERAVDIVRWVDRYGIDMDDEPEAFVRLRQGKRAMVLRHENGRCRFLGPDNRCGIYTSRPLGCRIFPFDPTFGKDGKLRRLRIIQATERCPYERDGNTDPDELRSLHERYEGAHARYNERVAEWNRRQQKRLRAGKAAQTAREFLEYLGLIEMQAQRAGASM